MPETKRKDLSGGFTIMEVALAATVLAFTLFGMIGVVESGSKMLDLSRKQTIAGQILHGEIDQLRLQSWATISGYMVQAGGQSQASSNGYAASSTLTTSNDTLLAMYLTVYPNFSYTYTVTRTVACLSPAQSNYNGSGQYYSSAPLLLQVTYTISWKGITGQGYSRTATTLVGYNGLNQVFQKS
ncbi:MAG TPA: hypothetical protein VGG34_10305 [Opitutaceae bacterium]